MFKKAHVNCLHQILLLSYGGEFYMLIQYVKYNIPKISKDNDTIIIILKLRFSLIFSYGILSKNLCVLSTLFPLRQRLQITQKNSSFEMMNVKIFGIGNQWSSKISMPFGFICLCLLFAYIVFWVCLRAFKFLALLSIGSHLPNNKQLVTISQLSSGI